MDYWLYCSFQFEWKIDYKNTLLQFDLKGKSLSKL